MLLHRRVFLHNKGLTLVEVLVAVVVLLFVSLAMMQTALVSIGANMTAELRNEAVSIAEKRMNEARGLPFDELVSDTADAAPDDNFAVSSCEKPPVSDSGKYPVKVGRTLRGKNWDFGTRRTVRLLSGLGESKEVTVLVRWEYANECYSHSVSAPVKDVAETRRAAE